jgi:hypothetical protein
MWRASVRRSRVFFDLEQARDLGEVEPEHRAADAPLAEPNPMFPQSMAGFGDGRQFARVIESDGEQGRDLSRLVVSRAGRLVATGDVREPYRIVGPGGEVVEPVSVFLRDLLVSGRSESTLRSYSVDLLRWWWFLDAVSVEWDRASRAEARDFSCGIQLTAKQRLQTSRPQATPTRDEVIEGVLAHHARQSRAQQAPPQPAPGYDPQSLSVLFGRPS